MGPITIARSPELLLLSIEFWIVISNLSERFNPLNAELNSICHLLALLGGATIVVVSRLRFKLHKTATKLT